MILKILSTLLTGIGGHYLNKRWDKAVLFLALFVLYCISCFVAIKIYLFSNMSGLSGAPEEISQQFKDTTTTIAIIYLSGSLLLWVMSLIITIVDARKAALVDNFKWTTVGVCAAVLTSLLSFLVLGFTSATAVGSLSLNHTPNVIESSQTSYSHSSHNFYEYIYLGGSPSDPEKLPDLPEGDGELRGRVTYDNRPAEAVTLHMVLNSKYRARKIITDAEGEFRLKLPVGKWKINMIQTESWPDKPDGDKFTIYHGGEEKLVGDSFNRHRGFLSDGRRVTIDGNHDDTHIELVIKNDIELVWPDERVSGIDASMSDVIRWKSYPLAAKYYVELKQLKREGTRTSYTQVSKRVLSGETFIPLSSIGHLKTKDKEIYEYAAEIYAFSKEGKLIGEHTKTYRGSSFILTDGHMFVEDKLQDLFDANSGEDLEQSQAKMELIMKDRQRIEAIEVLIDDDLIAEAEALLDPITSEYVKGEKEVLSGYILALKGNCKESKVMFEKALSINPSVCIPEEYKRICE